MKRIIAAIIRFHQNPWRRPYWQFPLLLAVFAIYHPARAFVDWADNL